MRAMRVLVAVVLVAAAGGGLFLLVAHLRDDAAAGADAAPVLARPSSAPAGPGTVTRKQARAALIRAGDLPAGWRRVSTFVPSPGAVTTVPPGCDDRPAGETLAAATFSQPVDGTVPGGSLDQTVVRPAGGTPLAALTALRDRLAGCRTYTASGVAVPAMTFELDGLAFPALGQATLAVRSRSGAGAVRIIRDDVYVAAGPVIVHLYAVTFAELPPQLLRGLATTAVARLA